MMVFEITKEDEILARYSDDKSKYILLKTSKMKKHKFILLEEKAKGVYEVIAKGQKKCKLITNDKKEEVDKK